MSGAADLERKTGERLGELGGDVLGDALGIRSPSSRVNLLAGMHGRSRGLGLTPFTPFTSQLFPFGIPGEDSAPDGLLSGSCMDGTRFCGTRGLGFGGTCPSLGEPLEPLALRLIVLRGFGVGLNGVSLELVI